MKSSVRNFSREYRLALFSLVMLICQAGAIGVAEEKTSTTGQSPLGGYLRVRCVHQPPQPGASAQLYSVWSE